MAVCLQLAQDGARRGPGNIGHIGDILMIDVDFDRSIIRRTGEAAIAEAEKNSHEALVMVADHQVVGSPHRKLEMLDRHVTEIPPCGGITPDNLVDGVQAADAA